MSAQGLAGSLGTWGISPMAGRWKVTTEARSHGSSVEGGGVCVSDQAREIC